MKSPIFPILLVFCVAVGCSDGTSNNGSSNNGSSNNGSSNNGSSNNGSSNNGSSNNENNGSGGPDIECNIDDDCADPSQFRIPPLDAENAACTQSVVGDRLCMECNPNRELVIAPPRGCPTGYRCMESSFVCVEESVYEPCDTEDDCPNGWYCSGRGDCVYGSSQNADMGISDAGDMSP